MKTIRAKALNNIFRELTCKPEPLLDTETSGTADPIALGIEPVPVEEVTMV